ncbi:AAA family ATPase [Pseudactinotalea terrae]|uniref:AAA family ATPase n=1 Tax=Pseudactinotalea terrae TaxID=1743262 RepID=UPI0012E1F8CE|nr:ATP-binding protein [Pseudactinotalea terrae]
MTDTSDTPGSSPRLVLMCGPAGAGKSTHAQALEAEGCTRVAIDDLLWEQGCTEHPVPERAAARAAVELAARVGALLDRGHDVVVDRAFPTRASREEYRRLGAERGAVVEVVFVSTPREVALARVASRAGSHAHDIVLTPELAAAYYDGFEIPGPEEGPLSVVSGDGGGATR